MDFERILQMTTSERNLALLQDEAFVDDVTEFLAIRRCTMLQLSKEVFLCI